MTTAIPTTRTARPSVSYDAIAPDVYPARVVRFVGLGIQDQPEFQGQKKDPAFKCAIQYELIGVDATGTNPDGTPIDPRPSCVFQDYFLFPGATRGKVFDMCRAIDASMEAAPRTLEWFLEHLGSIVMVQVGQYRTRDGKVKNNVQAVQPCPGFMKNTIGAARTDLVGFNPYSDSEANLAAYNKMFKFQRDMLLEAHDSKSIPFAGKEVQFNGNGAQQSVSPAARIQEPQIPEMTDMDSDSPF